MNWYGHHIGDWLKKTSDLTLVQDGVYHRLVDWYYVHEKPLPLPMREVANIARARGVRERTAVQFVVHRFFDLQPDGWHHSRCDEELASYARGAPDRETKRAHAKDRQKRAREKRSTVFETLRNAGIVPSWNATMEELRALMVAACITEPVTRDVTQTSLVMNGETHNLQPTTQGATHTVTLESATVTRAGIACKAIRKTGFQAVNPGDPRLLTLLEEGTTEDELMTAAAEAQARGKGWGWMLATVEGRKRDEAAARDDWDAWTKGDTKTPRSA